MRIMGLQGAVRGKRIRTTVPDPAQPCPRDKVNRQFQAPAPNRLWVSDFAHVATWRGFVYVAFAIDTYARRIVGWRVSRSPTAGFVLDALEQAIHDRRPSKKGGSSRIRIAARNTWRSATRSASSRKGSSPPSDRPGIRATTRWPRR